MTTAETTPEVTPETSATRRYPDTYYVATAKGLTAPQPLDGSTSCDVCIVGGGYTGVATALHLAERGYKTVVLESQRIGWGASGRNGGQFCSGQRVEPAAMTRLMGAERARMLWDLAEESKAIVRERIARHAIDCNLRPGLISAAFKAAHLQEILDYATGLRDDYGYAHIRPVSREEMREMLGSDLYHGGCIDTDAGHLHPLNYVLGLAAAAREAGARICEETPATALTRQGGRHLVRTPQGEVTADILVLACNGYLGKIEPRIAGTIMPINNFIIATEPLGAARARSIISNDAAVADSKHVLDYYRLSVDGRLLFGGGESYRAAYPRDIAGLVRRCMLRVFPQLADVKIDHAWGGTLAITMNRLPAYGRLGEDTYYAQGFSGQGVALTSLAGKVIAEAIAGDSARFDLLASVPTPAFPGGTLLRWPSLVAGMAYHALLDRL
ncbi:FAD-binding oxidoreductase [Pelagibius litoralis]|uniref:FAD-binding oxidoreductase n=1 Tax=Pelagibius litoralis TaxID=374515 RepID=A0A967F181_9PROT|nr:FAD-binding oxidoreductase [Pelagibius litoralis]NIA71091.1 FAD-binding oxidoreductase [Pelagibius litoralis]